MTLTEVQERGCMEHLTALLGMLDENIANDFEAIDENGDGFVTKQESFKAMDRNEIVQCPDGPPPGYGLVVGAPPSRV